MRKQYTLFFLVIILLQAVSCKEEPLTGLENGHEWVDLGLSVRWATSNVSGEHNLVDDTAYTSWGGKWRLPTKEEFEELIQNCTWEWADIGFSLNSYGYKISGKKKTYKGCSIFLPYTNDDCYYGEDVYSIFHYYRGSYWSSSTAYTTQYLYSLIFDSTSINIDPRLRNNKSSIRLVCPKGENINGRNDIAPLLSSDLMELILSEDFIFSEEKNIELENKLLSLSKYYEKESLKKMIETCNKLGTFHTAILLQTTIDRLCFQESIDRFLNDNKAKTMSNTHYKELDNWISKNTDSLVTELGSSLSARECYKFCRKYLNDRVKLNNNYNVSVHEFINNQDKESIGTVKQIANMISYQMFLADSILFKNQIKKYSIFNESITNGEFVSYDGYYKKYFIDVARPE